MTEVDIPRIENTMRINGEYMGHKFGVTVASDIDKEALEGILTVIKRQIDQERSYMDWYDSLSEIDRLKEDNRILQLRIDGFVDMINKTLPKCQTDFREAKFDELEKFKGDMFCILESTLMEYGPNAVVR